MPNIKQSVESTQWDENGNLLSRRTNKTLSFPSEPSYVKLYLQDIVYLSDLPSKHGAVLHELLKRSTYAGDKDGMQVVINASLKRRIQETLNFKNMSSISNAITDLVKGKLLYRVDVGMYNFNPYLFGKGDWADISRLRLEVSYDDIKGRTFRTTCEFQDELKKETESILRSGTQG
jgi:hypothetical protein